MTKKRAWCTWDISEKDKKKKYIEKEKISWWIFKERAKVQNKLEKNNRIWQTFVDWIKDTITDGYIEQESGVQFDLKKSEG